MTDAILFAEKFQLKNMVIVGGREAHLLTDMLVKYGVPVILDRIDCQTLQIKMSIYDLNKQAYYNKQAYK